GIDATIHLTAPAASLAVRPGTGRPRGGASSAAEESETAGSENRYPVRDAGLQRGSRRAVHALPRARRFRGRHEARDRTRPKNDLDGAADRYQLSHHA